jgi:glycosyltransferase involved in cell wall biosynthesis
MCAGFTLLRNNIEFCGAPSADSLTCRVCIYGESRKRHLLAVEILFQEISFDVVAPSRSALEVWTGGSKLPHRSSQVVEHCYIEHHSERVSIDTESQRGAPENPVRLAFIGFPEAHKGWHIFRELVSRINKMGVYKLFHFCSDVGAPTIYGVEKVSVRTSPFTRNAMVEALQKHEIDLTLVLSTWPETFSYVTYEALAAGCDVVAMSTSGNVADRILRDGRGIVALKREAMFGFFENLVAVAYVRCCHETPMHTGTLTPQGTTGSIEKALMCVA